MSLLCKVTAGSLTVSTATPSSRKQDGVLHDGVPLEQTTWSKAFEMAFIVPILCVLREMMSAAIDEASKQRNRLEAMSTTLMSGFENIYDAVADKFIIEGDSQAFNEFNATVASIKIQNGPVFQTVDKLPALYLACHRVLPLYKDFVVEMIQNTKADKESRVAPLKSMYRALEKSAFRVDGKQWSANCVLDVVRGMVMYENMQGIRRAFAYLCAEKSIKIVRIKNRFANKTTGGWRDCMVNFHFEIDSQKVICELQLVHKKLMVARKQLSGHKDYVTYRAAVELSEAAAARALWHKARLIRWATSVLRTVNNDKDVLPSHI